MVFSPTGNVGIGTTNPVSSSSVEIHKAFTSSGIYPAGNLTFSSNNNTHSWETGAIEGYISLIVELIMVSRVG